jgi:putative heme iron utilization protein
VRDEDLELITRLLRVQRWGALATLEADGAPYASAVAFAAEPEFAGFLLHLSRLAPHTGNLLADPRASLVVSDMDTGTGDPQTLPRVSLMGKVEIINREAAGFAAAKACYLSRLPTAEPLFEFPDFLLFRLVPSEARFVGGFARARRLDAAALRAL